MDYEAMNPAEDTSSSGESDEEHFAAEALAGEQNPAEEHFGAPEPNPYLVLNGLPGQTDDAASRRTHFLTNLRSGQQVDVLDSVSKWAEAEVLQVDTQARRVEISFLYWADRWNEWIDLATEAGAARLAEAGTQTFQEGGVLRVNHRIECLDETLWREAVVVDAAPQQVKVHFMKWHAKFDVWLPRTSPRIRPFGRKKRIALVKQQQARQRRQPLASAATHAGPPEHRERTISSLSNCYTHYVGALEKRGLIVHSVEGDGNCLFRAVAHQIYGNADLHRTVRAACCDYMEQEADFFEQFVEGDRSDFARYLAYKRLNAVWGDDPEVQALCEIYNRPAEIWAYDHRTGARKLRTFHEPSPVSPALADAGPAADTGPAVDENHGDTGEIQASMNPADAPSAVSTPETQRSRPSPPAPTAPDPASQAPTPASVVPPMRLSYYGGGHYDSLVSSDSHPGAEWPRPGILEHEALRRCAGREDLARREGSARRTPGQRSGDGGKEEEAELDLALEASRLDFDAQFEDLDEALSASVESYEQELGDVAQQVQQQSEEAMLKAAVDASLVEADRKPTAGDLGDDEALLKATMEASAKEAPAGDDEDALLRAAIEASREGSQHAHGDHEMQKALLASQVEDDDEAVMQMALQASMQEGFELVNPAAQAYDGGFGGGDEDEELRRVLELSQRDR